MAELKTKVTDDNVEDYLKAVDNDQRREDSLILLEMFTRITGEKPKLWGTSIVGFGQYHYKSERSSQEGDWPLTGFSPRKQNLTLYVMDYQHNLEDLLEKLGKHKTSVGCLYINKLADVDLAVLEQLIKKSYEVKKQNLLKP